MTIWFTSDTHFYHYNIIEFCNRDIGLNPKLVSRDEACEAMNEVLINGWNSCVDHTDEVYFLGDFGFCGKEKGLKVLNRLNGIKYAIRGNHDYALFKKEEIQKNFVWVKDYCHIRVHSKYQDDNGDEIQYHQPIVLCHFPLLSWDNMAHGSWHLHGHTHGSIQRHNENIMRYDVGVDPNGMKPISFDQLKGIMAMRSIKPVEGDYHGAYRVRV